MLIELLIIYGTLATIFGIFSMFMQCDNHPDHVEWWRMILVFVLNTIGFPITILISLHKKTLKYGSLLLMVYIITISLMVLILENRA